MNYKLVTVVGLALFCASLSQAATRIEKGQDYELTGYLVVRMGAAGSPRSSKVYVALTSAPNGDAASRAGREDVTLVNGTFKENLVKLAKETGSTKKMAVIGVGTAEGALAVSSCAPAEGSDAALLAAKKDALARYSEEYPGSPGGLGHSIRPAIKSAKVESAKKRIVVECDREGGQGGWNGPAVRYAYDLNGKYLGLADDGAAAGDAKARMQACRRDALSRYAADHPARGMFRPSVKSADLDEATGYINVVCDVEGGLAGWNNKAVSYVYDETGKFVSETAE